MFIYNFAKFTEWPADVLPASAPLVVCVVGEDSIYHALDETVASKAAGGHSVQVRRVKSVEDARVCHILFFGGNLDKRSKEILASAKSGYVLTVGQGEQFTGAGGTVQLFLEDSRVAFFISPGAVERSHLKVSSKLLSLARVPDSAKRGSN